MKKTCNTYYFLLVFMLLLASCGKEQAPPNVILIMTDDQGYGDLACHGNPIIKTPNLDTLYTESLRFTDFHVNSFCAPTRAALMTGRMSDRTHVRTTVYARNYLNKDETTMAEFFKATGYKTAHFGKWHIGNNYPYRPMDRGFDTWVGQGGGTSSASDYWANNRLDDYYTRNGEWEKIEGFGTDIFFDETMDFIKNSENNPFFVYLATFAPHGPMNVIEKWRDPYTQRGAPPRSVEWGDTWDLFATLNRFDYNLGRLRHFLKENDLEENTILIFTTDNGSADGHVVYNAGMTGNKGSSYEGGHRVPMFIHWPGGGLKGGSDIDEFTWHIDLLPTLVDLCNLNVPEKGHLPLDGMSWAPLLENNTESNWNENDRMVFMHTQNVMETPVKGLNSLIATEDWMLINGKALYNIKKDPKQENNVAADNESLISSFMKSYDRFWEEVDMENDPLPRPVIGTKYQETTWLTPEDWVRTSGNGHSWNQRHVLAGVDIRGFWPVNIPEKGIYKFEVRRWPVELDKPFVSGLPERVDPGITRLGEPVKMEVGKAIQADKVVLEIDGDIMEKNIELSDTHARFEVELAPGDKNLRAWLKDGEEIKQGAYYIYARKLN